MRKAFLITVLLTFSVHNFMRAQKVSWAYHILSVSSEKGKKEFSAFQALGRPNVLPLAGEDERAWQPAGTNDEYIKVMFSTAIKAKYVLIGESYHPGHIKQLFIYDMTGKEYEIKIPEEKKITEQSRLRAIATDTKFLISAVKIVLTPGNAAVGIDAIGLSDDDKPYGLIATDSEVAKANIKPNKLNSGVNSPHPEMGPLISPDGMRLYFSRVGDPKNAGGKQDIEDIWYSDWDTTKKQWKPAQNLSELNNKDANYINSISPDGNTVLLGNRYFPKGHMKQGVSISHRTENGWTTPKIITIENIDNNISENTDFYLSNSNKYLVMAIEQKKDSYGDRDLYVSFRKNDTTFGKPLNLGMRLNTHFTEANPFLAADDKTLYFASDGFAGFGGSDIYVTRRLDDTWLKWTEPENLGPKINTSFNEMFFSTSASGDKVLYTSGDPNYGDLDIFMINLPKTLKPMPVAMIKGRVLNSKTYEPIPDVKIFFEDLSNGKEMGTASSAPLTGEFQIILPSGVSYGYLAEKPGFISVHENIDLKKMEEYFETTKNLYLTPVEAGAVIAVNNIFFDKNKTTLRKESYPELNRLATLMKDNPDIKVEIAGHSDNEGTAESNVKLGQKRAEAVVNYLVKSGIDKGRLIPRSYGDTKPAASNDTEEGQQQNRRVEFKILPAKFVKG